MHFRASHLSERLNVMASALPAFQTLKANPPPASTHDALKRGRAEGNRGSPTALGPRSPSGLGTG